MTSSSQPARPASTEHWAPAALSVLSRCYLGLLAGAALWAVLPVLLGWHSTVVMSGSMAPRVPTGSVLVTSPVDPARLRPGNVVLFVDPADPARLISHRLVGVDPQGRLLTRGDANSAADSTPVPPGNVRGVGRLLVPAVGQPYRWARTAGWLPLTGWVSLTTAAVYVVHRTPVRPVPGHARSDGGRADPPAGDHGRRRRRRRRARAALSGAAGVSALLVCTSLGLPAGAGPGPLTLSTAAAFAARTSNPGDAFAPDPAAQYGGSNYAETVLADSPSLFWQFDETTGTTAVNSGTAGAAAAGSYTGTGVTYSTSPDATPREGGSAVTLNGSTGCVRGQQLVTNPQTYSIEVWFRTTSTAGGKLIGFGNGSGTGPSSNYDRHLYLTNTGQAVFGAYTGSTVVITTPGSYNDGRWHLATATAGPAGMTLYLDGAPAGSNPNTVSQAYNGSWRVGCDNLASWPATPTSQYLAGQVDNAAVYPTQLTAARAAAHWYAA